MLSKVFVNDSIFNLNSIEELKTYISKVKLVSSSSMPPAAVAACCCTSTHDFVYYLGVHTGVISLRNVIVHKVIVHEILVNTLI